ncbi:hypothetical protein EJ419_02130 [Alloscardovia theropitheci]|uniref:Putative T7SS secretion signal domain-containing protein n=1 Tax=Alloscardovia theropitheci TaxID=2496842 RepID=A0A4R0QQR8_9BIFI|nr:hypothetical protein [Alloscardovia theropitheci]TCD54654.1 hypothetical protein EJ419_02130 [Alloscardovia theropitheci]
MSRHDISEWNEVGYSKDQVPGDSESIATLSAKFATNANSLIELAGLLKKVNGSASDGAIWTGKGAEEFKKEYKDFDTKVTKVADSFEKVKTQLNTMADTVSQYQPLANNALDEALEAKRRMKNLGNEMVSANATLNRAKHDVQVAKSLPPSDKSAHDKQSQASSALSSAQSQLDMFKAQLSSARNDLDDAKRRINSYHDSYDEAAQNVATQIRDAQNTGDLKTGFFEKWYYSDVWRGIVKVAEVVGFVAGIAAICLGGGGLIIAGILLATSLISFVDTAVGYQVGDKDGWDVLFSAVALGLSVVGMKGAASEFETGLKAVRSSGSPVKMGQALLGRFDKASSVFIVGTEGASQTVKHTATWGNYIKNNLKGYGANLINPWYMKTEVDTLTGFVGKSKFVGRSEFIKGAVEHANELGKGIHGMVNDLTGDKSARESGISTSVELVKSTSSNVFGEIYDKFVDGPKKIGELITGEW